MPDMSLEKLLRRLLPAIDQRVDVQELTRLLTHAWERSGTGPWEPVREFLRGVLDEAVTLDDGVADTSGCGPVRSDQVSDMLETILSHGGCGLTVSEHEPVVVSWSGEPFGERKVAWTDPRLPLRLAGVRPGMHRLVAETERVIWSGILDAEDVYHAKQRGRPWRLAAASTPTTPPAQPGREEMIWSGALRLMIIPGPPPPTGLEAQGAHPSGMHSDFGGVLELRTSTEGVGNA